MITTSPKNATRHEQVGRDEAADERPDAAAIAAAAPTSA
jgi:hypothetical protein